MKEKTAVKNKTVTQGQLKSLTFNKMVSEIVSHSFNLRHHLTQPYKSNRISLIVVFNFLKKYSTFGCRIAKQCQQISKSEHYMTRRRLKIYQHTLCCLVCLYVDSSNMQGFC